MKKNDRIKNYLYAFVFVAAATILAWQVKVLIEPANFTVLYLLIVVLSALWWGIGPSVFTALIGVLFLDFFLIPPYISLSVHDFRYVYTFAGFIIMAIMVGTLAAKTRKQAETARENARQTAMLYKMSRELAMTDTLQEVVFIICANITGITGYKCALFMKREGSVKRVFSGEGFPGTEDAEAVASWVFENGKNAGHGTDVLSSSDCTFIPLVESEKVIAVLGVFSGDTMTIPGPGEDLKDALFSQAASALKKVILHEQAEKIRLDKESGKLQNALLNSISHDLRTPLVTITGALSSILEDHGKFQDETKEELLRTAAEEAKRLNALVSNLLDMTRVESGRLILKKDPADISDLLGASVSSLGDKALDRIINIEIPPDMPEINVDYTLMMRVFVNLIDNALKYSPQDQPVDIIVNAEDSGVTVSFRDHGFGIPAADLEKVFDKFYRAVKPRKINGTGLGLAICRGIVEAHGGSISASNAPEGGAVLKVILPLIEGAGHG